MSMKDHKEHFSEDTPLSEKTEPGTGGLSSAAGQGAKPMCTRVSPRARRLIEAAAARRGWSPSHLLRVAAIEKAAEILNLDGTARLDFDGVAWDVASRLWQTFETQKRDASGAREAVYTGTAHSRDDSRQPPQRQDSTPGSFEELLDRLEQAARYGGRGFLQILLEKCRLVGKSWRDIARKPLDPEEYLR